MTFAVPTLEQLRARSFAAVLAGLGIGAVPRRTAIEALSNSQAGQAHLQHGHVEWASRQLLPNTADAEELDKHADLVGLSRKEAAPSTGVAEFTGTGGSVVPLGTQLRDPSGLRYRTTAAGLLGVLAIQIPVEGVDTGSATNLALGTVLTISQPLVGVDVTAPVADNGSGVGLSGGADRETDEELRARILARRRGVLTGGSSADYVLWARSVPGVTRAWALPGFYGTGTVGITCMTDGEPDPLPTPAVIAAVQAVVDENRPAGTKAATVFSPTPLPWDAAIELQPFNATLEAAVRANLDGFFRSAQVAPGSTLVLSQIVQVIASTPGILDHTLDSLANVAAQPFELHTVGTLTFSAIVVPGA